MRTFYEAWWYSEDPSDYMDLMNVPTETGPERDTLEEAKQDILDEDPEFEAFVNLWRDDPSELGVEFVEEFEDPRYQFE